MVTTLALCIPHRPDVPARVDNVARLRRELGAEGVALRVLDERLPNREWARRMWRWGVASGADFFLTLQDDTELAPRFLECLRALLPSLPRSAILGLGGHHPGLRQAAAPWARSRHWVVGWAYGMWLPTLAGLVDFDASGAHPQLTEDSLVNTYAGAHGLDVWHPVPSLVDHRTDFPSTYGNDGAQPFRRSHVRWEGHDPAWLTDPGYWRPRGGALPPLLQHPTYASVQGAQNGPPAPPGFQHTVMASHTGVGHCPHCGGQLRHADTCPTQKESHDVRRVRR